MYGGRVAKIIISFIVLMVVIGTFLFFQRDSSELRPRGVCQSIDQAVGTTESGLEGARRGIDRVEGEMGNATKGIDSAEQGIDRAIEGTDRIAKSTERSQTILDEGECLIERSERAIADGKKIFDSVERSNRSHGDGKSEIETAT